MDTITQCGRTFIHIAHDTDQGRCVGLTGDEVQATRDPWTLPDEPLSDSEPEWPRGPLVQHLRAVRQLYREALSAIRVLVIQNNGLGGGAEAVAVRQEVMDHHLLTVAAFTATRASSDLTTRRPRPVVELDDNGFPLLPEGWESVIMGVDTHTGAPVVLAGWVGDTFHQYAPTEQIVRVCVDALEDLNG